MRKNHTIISCVFTLCISVFTFLNANAGEWVSVKNGNEKVDVQLISSTSSETVLKMNLCGFYKNVIATPTGNKFSITALGMTAILESGAPDLSKIAASIIIPDEARMSSEITSSSFIEFNNYDIGPSKGSFSRTILPGEIPFTYGESFSKDKFYPGTLAALRNPFILRDYRGQTVLFYPFQYNPITKTLRVYTEITVRVFAKTTKGLNTLQRNSLPEKIESEFANIYTDIFKNGGNTINYLPVVEEGSMLIISHGPFMQSMQPFIDWKTRKGLKVEMVDVATIGNDDVLIKDYIQNYYNSHNLKYVLLVGDVQQIATPMILGGASDPSYGYLTGNDSYAEVFVGRFSAQNTTDVDVQVQKAIQYEMNPNLNGNWYHKGVAIGSDQGAGIGYNGLADWDFMRTLIRPAEMNYSFTDVDELYDGTHGGNDAPGDPVANDLKNSIDSGCAIITYCGHGAQNTCVTTNFSSSNVASLTNHEAWPIFWSVACVNGDFVNGTCIAETFLRAHDGALPKGCVATLMSSINQSWVEPMDGELEMVSIYTEAYANNIKRSFGGISSNGCMKMNDDYGTAGDDMTDTWHCFGDPSLEVRTNTPTLLTATHNLTEQVGVSQFNINCNRDGALACISMNGEILGTGIVNGGVVNIIFQNPINQVDTFQVTVTAYNCKPYMADVPVTSVPSAIENLAVNISGFNIFPNPATNFTTINFSLENATNVTLQIFNIADQVVATLCDDHILKAGNHAINLNTSQLATGLYSCRLMAGKSVENIKFMIRN